MCIRDSAEVVVADKIAQIQAKIKLSKMLSQGPPELQDKTRVPDTLMHPPAGFANPIGNLVDPRPSVVALWSVLGRTSLLQNRTSANLTL